MNYQSITYPDVNNGLGCRVTLWVSGCPHHCKGCHNQHTWDPDSGNEFTAETKQQLIDILKLPYIKGLTISGGEPLALYNLSKVSKLIEEFKILFPKKDIWLYTGYTIEELKNPNVDMKRLSYIYTIFENVDYIVEGPYIDKLRDITLPFRGSSNQRIFQVCKTTCHELKFKQVLNECT